MRTKASLIKTVEYDMSAGYYVTYGIVEENGIQEERLIIKDINHVTIATYPSGTIVKFSSKDKLIRIQYTIEALIDIVLIKNHTIYFYYNDEFYTYTLPSKVVDYISNAVFGASYATPLTDKLFINHSNQNNNASTTEEIRSNSEDN